MKLLLDQNISRKLLKRLEVSFPGSNHVYLLGLHTGSDEEVWNYAKEHGYTIVTQDSDFYDRGLIYGYPPKVVWLRIGNASTKSIEELFVRQTENIIHFGNDISLGCIEIY
ncbi:MAG: DUF5615 family PIN-like protein [Candidatus Roizmanbacteria bacterium]|nr:DUF5615 family PIN-like protein [Candidatus Roizmanbacteria bacterium]